MAIAQVAQAQSGGPAPGAPAAQSGRGRRATPYLLLLPGMVWLLIFFAMPILSLAGTSLQTRVPGTLDRFTQTFRFANYVDYAREYAPQFGRSFLYAGIATLLALLISYPLAYLIAFRAGRWRNLLLVLVVAPFFCSFILRTLAWKQILGDGGFVVETLKALHVLGPTQSLTATPFAVVAGITYNFLPFMTLPLYSSLERIDPLLHEAGYDLYGTGFTVLRKVTFPLSMPGVVAGTLLTFIPAAGDFVNATLLGRQPRTQMVGNVIEARFFGLVDYPAAATLSFLLMAVILVLVTLYVRRAGTEELV
jgi:spermidine/putrescine transport system permease protein